METLYVLIVVLIAIILIKAFGGGSPDDQVQERVVPEISVAAQDRSERLREVASAPAGWSVENVFPVHVAGVTFRNDDGTSRQWIIRSYASAGDLAVLLPEPGNKYDANAIAVHLANTGLMIGHLPGSFAAVTASKGDLPRLRAKIERVTKGADGIYGVVLAITKYVLPELPDSEIAIDAASIPDFRFPNREVLEVQETGDRPNRVDVARTCEPGDRVLLVRAIRNYDSYAVAVFRETGEMCDTGELKARMLGFLSSHDAHRYSQKIKEYGGVAARIVAIRENPVRITIEVERKNKVQKRTAVAVAAAGGVQ